MKATQVDSDQVKELEDAIKTAEEAVDKLKNILRYTLRPKVIRADEEMGLSEAIDLAEKQVINDVYEKAFAIGLNTHPTIVGKPYQEGNCEVIPIRSPNHVILVPEVKDESGNV